jgi:hypothetical protein
MDFSDYVEVVTEEDSNLVLSTNFESDLLRKNLFVFINHTSLILISRFVKIVSLLKLSKIPLSRHKKKEI